MKQNKIIIFFYDEGVNPLGPLGLLYSYTFLPKII